MLLIDFAFSIYVNIHMSFYFLSYEHVVFILMCLRVDVQLSKRSCLLCACGK